MAPMAKRERATAQADCRFCAIVAGHVPAHRVLEDAAFVAFLDHRPLFFGHCLVIPRRHVPSLAELPEELAGPLLERVRRLALAVERGLGAEGCFVAINHRVSQSVPHLHVHVVPRRRGDGLRGFFWPRQKYPSEQAARETAEAIRAALAALGRGPVAASEGLC
jgi:histidine triad (HIT) family protein